MRKLFLILLMFCSYSFAKTPTKITVIWGWNYTQAQTLLFKTVLDQANTNQNKYNFVLESKPGSGGVVATRMVLAEAQTGKLTLLAHAVGFFSRPYLYSDSGYSFDQFKPVLVLGHQQAGLVTKNKTIEELRQKKRITIGTNGIGSSGHLMAEKLSKTIFAGTQVDIIQFGTILESITSVQGGFTDMSSAYMSDIVGKEGLIMAGITGRQPQPGAVLFKDIGASEMADFNTPFFILATVDADSKIIGEIQTILLQAQKSSTVKDIYKFQEIVQLEFYKNPATYNLWYKNLVEQFAEFTKGSIIIHPNGK